MTKTFFGSRHEKQIASSMIFDTKGEKVFTNTPGTRGQNSRDYIILHGRNTGHAQAAGREGFHEHILSLQLELLVLN